MSGKILVVDDEPQIRNILTCILQDEGYHVATAESGEKAISIAAELSPDVVLMDLNLPGINGIDAMVNVKAILPQVAIIVLTAYGTIPSAVDATKKGAYDYLSKPFDNDELLLLIKRALEHINLTAEIKNLREQLQEKYRYENIIGVSSKMQTVFEKMTRVCQTDVTVLIQGESGTGKELIVNAIHYNSARKTKPFVAVNCAAIPTNLLESEFFGHEKGAFTDAKQLKIGKFEQAHTGTLFLDEIGELSMEAQVKLLRALDKRNIYRVGGNKSINIDVRLIAATNKDLQKEVEKGNFRLDLLYRLNIFTIEVPPLRERREDIPLLVEHFIQKYNEKLHLKIKTVSKEAMMMLQSYDWPGNIRDLENAIQGSMIIAHHDIIESNDLPLRVQGFPELTTLETNFDKGLDYKIRKITEHLERQILTETLHKFNGNRTETANSLKISRKTLFNKLKHYNLT